MHLLPSAPGRLRLPALAVLGALLLAAAGTAQGLAAPADNHKLYLPVVSRSAACPASSGNHYASGPVYQIDTDNPVRPAWNHADKNLALRGYKLNPSGFKGFKNYGSPDPTQPPQLATLFSPNRVPAFTNGYQVYNWNWAPSPNPGTRGSLDTQWDISVLGLGVTPGEALHVPASGYDIGQGMEVIVLYADSSSITLEYRRFDSVAAYQGIGGYTLHVDNLCTDPNLLAVYHSLDADPGPRYVFYNNDHELHYNLPTLPAGQVFGTARDGEIRVAIVDTGSFMDPRSCGDWWQIRPGHSCP